MIFYFSGTGNSAWAARRIAEETGEELCDVGSLLREGSVWEDSVAKAVFVTPTYAWRIPRLVEDWIRRSSFGEAAAWFVMTCGDEIGSAGRHNRALCGEKGMRPMGTGKLIMPENYTAMFRTPDPETAKAVIREADPSLRAYADLIRRGQTFPEEKEGLLDGLRTKLANPAFYRLFVKDTAFRVTEACISCGKCALGCPLRNIRLEDGKPVWGGNCTHCMACINYCPMDAIEYGAATRRRHHYTCPF